MNGGCVVGVASLEGEAEAASPGRGCCALVRLSCAETWQHVRSMQRRKTLAVIDQWQCILCIKLSLPLLHTSHCLRHVLDYSQALVRKNNSHRISAQVRSWRWMHVCGACVGGGKRGISYCT